MNNRSKKYEFTGETCIVYNGVELHRIRALKDISGVVSAGELGGWFGGKVMEVRGDDGRVYTFPYTGVGITKMERNTVDGSERVLPQELNSYR